MRNFLKTLALLFIIACACNVNAQEQITVGTLVGGEPTLYFSDEELTDTLDFVVNGKTLSNCSIESASDSLGVFYYIQAEGTSSTQANPSQIAVILITSGNDFIFDTATGCTMECIAALPCTSCGQTVLERCKRQVCTCNSGSGGCIASITYPDDE